MTATIIQKPKKNRFWLWFAWAFGIRTLGSDSEYGPKLAKYRKYTSIPVMAMSIGVFLLIGLKIMFAFIAFTTAFNALDPEEVVLQHDLNTPVHLIVLSTMIPLFWAVFTSTPLWVQLPLVILWFLAFVVDFIICAILATDKGLWWKRHWGGTLIALITLP